MFSLLFTFKFASQIFARLSIVQTSLTLHSAYANIRLKLVLRPINCLFAKRKELALLKQLFFFNANFAGCVPVKRAKVFALKANNNSTTRASSL